MKGNTLSKGANIFLEYLGLGVVLTGLYFSSQYNFLLFHSLVELSTIIISVSIFLMALVSRRFFTNYYLLFMQISFLFVAIIDVLHMLSFKGMGIFMANDANLPTQLWIAARYLQSFALLVASAFFRKTFKVQTVIASFLLITAALFLSIFYWQIFPDCFIEGAGLTPFKITSEYVIIIIFAVSWWMLYKNREALDGNIYRWMTSFVVANILAEFAFTRYANVFDNAIMIGHLFKFSGFFFFGKILVFSLSRPYQTLFKEIEDKRTSVQIDADLKEKQLIESVIRYQNVLENMLEGCQIIGLDWRYLFINDAAALQNRRPKEELLGNNFVDMWPGIESTELFGLQKKCMEERTAHVMRDYEFVFPDGSRGWYDISLQPIPEGLFILSHEITDRKKAELRTQYLNRLYATLSQVNHAIVRVKDRDELFRTICQVAVEDGKFDLAWVGLVEHAKGAVVPVSVHGTGSARLPFESINFREEPFKSGLTGRAIQTNKVIYSKDIQSDPTMRYWQELAKEQNYHAAAVVPFHLNGNVVGFLKLFSKDMAFFDDQELLNLLDEMAMDLSHALEMMEREEQRKQDKEKIRQHVHDLRFINALNESVNRGDEIEQILGLVTSEMTRNLDCTTAVVATPDADNRYYKVIELQAKSPLLKRVEGLIRVSAASLDLMIPMTGENPFVNCIKTGKSIIINDPDELTSLMSEFTAKKHLKKLAAPAREILGLETAMVVPIKIGDDSLGVLQIARTALFTEEDQARVKTIVVQLAAAISRKQAQEELLLQAAMMANMADSICLVRESNGVILFTNARFDQMFGYSKGELTGRHVSILHAPGEKDPQETAAEIASLLKEKGVWKGEIHNIRRDGTKIWCHVIVTTFNHSKYGLVGVAAHRDISEQKQAQETIKDQINRLEALRKIDQKILNTTDLSLTVESIIDIGKNTLNVDAVGVLLLNPYTQMLEYLAGTGFRSKSYAQSSLRLGQGHAGRAALGNKVFFIPDLRNPGEPFLRADLLAGEDFVSFFCVPLVSKGEICGVLEIFHRAPLDPDNYWRDFLNTVVGQIAIAIENNQMFEGMRKANIEMKLAYETTIEGWSRALDYRDKETEGHTLRVTEMTLLLARTMGMKEEELVHIRRGALLHDIGKMGIPDHILLKPGKLTDEEWVLMRRHPIIAHNLLQSIDYLRPALNIPYSHHEKWDGSGYPTGLTGKHIPLEARIFSVIDVWDALTSDRPYRKAWPRKKALDYIKEEAGRHFDPQVVEAFTPMVSGD